MNANFYDIYNREINWVVSVSDPYTVEVIVDGSLIKLRFNDFPEEVLCTLIVGGKEFDVEEIPKNWKLPGKGGGNDG